MARFVCVVQEGQRADERRGELEQGLRDIGVQAFGDTPGDDDIDWRVMRTDFAWTAGEPSTSSIVVRSVPVGLDDDRRERFMRDVCELWERVTECSKDEIVVTALDGPLNL